MMKIFGYKISVMPWRDRWWSNICLGLALLITLQGAYERDWFISLRLGDSVIPTESELVWTGPFEMREIRQRNGSLVSFTRPIPDGGTYRVDMTVFPEGFERYVALHKGQAIAWLKLYEQNSFRPVWGVKIGTEEVLNYERAWIDYSICSDPFRILFSGAGFIFVALISAFRITRINHRQGD